MKLATWTIALVLMLMFNIPIGVSGQTQLKLNYGACDKYMSADRDLNQIYQKILRDYAEDKNFIQKMKIAQRAWIAFRDAHMNSLYPESDSPSRYGSVYPTCRCAELESLTRNRINSLREWVDGVQEGDVCPGSRKIKR